jgi:hypothetical protein
MDCIEILPNMRVLKTQDDLVKGKKYAYASNGYVLGEYYGSKIVSNYCIDKCKCKMDAHRVIYEFHKGNRGEEVFEFGLVEIENGSIPEMTKNIPTK